LPVRSPDELLTLASIVEKETGQPAERPRIAGVFARRLKLGMRLQTDPTVIYGMGSAYNGNIRKDDLLTDTPYNTTPAPACRRRRSPCLVAMRCRRRRTRRPARRCISCRAATGHITFPRPWPNTTPRLPSIS
jgi:hypothetical protein